LFSQKILLSLAAAGFAFMGTAIPAKALNCVQFVHQVSSLKISGDAWQWWNNAALGHYARGTAPQHSAVLVFDHTSRMTHGHVAIVSHLVDRRTIEIDHANWSIGGHGRGKVTHGVRVQDVSDRNDWTSVRVWNDVANCYGRPYKTMGFIYAR
jgi:hypothetical protein